MKVYGLWYGGAGYSSGDPEECLEEFPSIGDAKWALRIRYDSNGVWQCDFNYVNREAESVYCPAVDRESEIHLFLGMPQGDFYPDRIIKFGPRGGVRVEMC